MSLLRYHLFRYGISSINTFFLFNDFTFSFLLHISLFIFCYCWVHRQFINLIEYDSFAYKSCALEVYCFLIDLKAKSSSRNKNCFNFVFFLALTTQDWDKRKKQKILSIWDLWISVFSLPRITPACIRDKNRIWQCNISLRLECVELLCHLIRLINTINNTGYIHWIDLNISLPVCALSLL